MFSINTRQLAREEGGGGETDVRESAERLVGSRQHGCHHHHSSSRTTGMKVGDRVGEAMWEVSVVVVWGGCMVVM